MYDITWSSSAHADGWCSEISNSWTQGESPSRCSSSIRERMAWGVSSPAMAGICHWLRCFFSSTHSPPHSHECYEHSHSPTVNSSISPTNRHSQIVPSTTIEVSFLAPVSPSIMECDSGISLPEISHFYEGECWEESLLSNLSLPDSHQV